MSNDTMASADPAATAQRLAQVDLDAIRAFLDDVLETRAQGLGTTAGSYVVKGSPQGALHKIAAHVNAEWLGIGHMGELYSPGHAAQHVFLAPEGWDAPVVRRLGEVIATIMRNVAQGRYARVAWPGPDFLCALAQMSRECLERVSWHNVGPGPLITHPQPGAWLLNGPRCLEMLALQGDGQGELVRVVFSPLNAGSWGTRSLDALTAMSALPDVLAAAPEKTAAGAGALRGAGLLAFIELLEKTRLASLPALQDFLFDVATREESGEAALHALLGGDAAQTAAAAAARLAAGGTRERLAAVRILARLGLAGGGPALLERRLGQERSPQVREQIERELSLLRERTNGMQDDRPGGYVAISGEWVATGPPPAAAEEAGVSALLTWLQAQDTCHSAPPLPALVAGHFDLIDQALGLAPRQTPLLKRNALRLLGHLPAVPRRYLGVLLELAIGDDDEEAHVAHALLDPLPGITAHIAPLLASAQVARRIAIAAWLRMRAEREAIPPLRAALAHEKSTSAREALLDALAVCGDGLQEEITVQMLLAQARTGLLQTPVTIAGYIPFEQLPQLTWQDGSPVAPEILQWWLIEAERLKNPQGRPIGDLLLDRLERRGAEQLAMQVLTAFVTHDTHSEGPEHVGILALTRHAPPLEAARIAASYFSEHGNRLPQCRALLDVLARHPVRECLHLMLVAASRGTSTSYDDSSVRQHADALLDAIASKQRWTRAELADRAVPTLGLDAQGALPLRAGERNYTASIDASLQIVLRNEQGKAVSSLPRGTDPAVIRTLSDLRRELRPLVRAETSRLEEAMRTGRVWQTNDILSLLFQHPIAARLCELTIFAGLDTRGQLIQTFRPAGDGTYISADGDPVDLGSFAGIRIATRALLAEGGVSAWQQHVEDYRLVPLLPQLK